MSCVFYVVLTLVTVQSPIIESGLIKKVPIGIIGGEDVSNQQIQYYKNPEENVYQNLGIYERDTTHIENQDYSNANEPNIGFSTLGKQPEEHGTSHTPTKMIQGCNSKSFHTVSEDYLVPNGNESLQHQHRPTAGCGGGRKYNKKPSSKTSQNQNYTPNHNRYNENDYSNGQTPKGNNYREKLETSDNSQITESTHRQRLKSCETKVGENGNCITLTSGNITCAYSSIKDEGIENWKMTCNNKECNLENNSKKSSLWVCDKIKCTVAKIDFSKNIEGKKLLECTMNNRSIIIGQDKPCGPDQKGHNGRCRKVFGA